jgi:hypothetical protein
MRLSSNSGRAGKGPESEEENSGGIPVFCGPESFVYRLDSTARYRIPVVFCPWRVWESFRCGGSIRTPPEFPSE